MIARDLQNCALGEKPFRRDGRSGEDNGRTLEQVKVVLVAFILCWPLDINHNIA